MTRGERRLAIAVIQQAIQDARLRNPITKRQVIDKHEARNFLRSPLRKEDREFWTEILNVPEMSLASIPIYPDEMEEAGLKWQKRS